jgi:hypothetical protein
VHAPSEVWMQWSSIAQLETLSPESLPRSCWG